MKLLKELFSFDEYDDNEDYSRDDEDEFDFDFDFEEPEPDESERELDFDDGDYSNEFNFDDDDDDSELPDHDFGDEESEDEYGSEEDYPENIADMPHDEFDDDGEGGLVSDEEAEVDAPVGSEVEEIKSEIESLYARLGKLAAAGDLSLFK